MRQVELCKDSTNYDNDEVNLVFEATKLMIQKGKEAAMVVASMVKNERLFDIVAKETEEMINMCESLDRWEKEIEKESVQKGVQEALLKMTKEMLEKGLSEEFILCFANINKRALSQGIDTKLNEKARIEPGLIYR